MRFERVRSARGRRLSSTRWLQRQLNDPYVQAAKRDGYRSRAAYKLLQIDDRFELLKLGCRVVDLGAAPGGWTQVAVNRVQSMDGHPSVVAIDILEMEPLPGADILLGDIEDEAAVARLCAAIGSPADLVLSDMAVATTGHASTDHLRTLALAEAAFLFACEVLTPGGGFVNKVFQGADEPALFDAMTQKFGSVRRFKPKASRSDSVEMFLIGMGFKDPE
ncbi:MAG: rRNA methyltransferase [Rhodospirillaceae bacterium]|nr:rRNA methyltransferase [Rhodospirillaceae bacterium]